MGHRELVQELIPLVAGFADLGARLSEAAIALKEPGAPPAGKLVEDLAVFRRDFASLRAKALDLATILAISPSRTGEEVVSVKDLEALLRDLGELEKKKAQAEEARQRALPVLDRVLALVHRDESNFKPLLDCQAKARDLRRAIAEAAWQELPEDTQLLAAGIHPLAALLALAERIEELTDAQWESLSDVVSAALGKTLVGAASRGKLVGAAAARAPKLHEEVRQPAAAAPAGADISPDEIKHLERRVNRLEESVWEDERAPLAQSGLERARASGAPAERATGAKAPPGERAPARRAVPLGPLHPVVEEALKTLEARRFAESLWAQDAQLWSADSEQQALIRNRLGWLTSPALMKEKVGELREFAAEIRHTRHTHVVLLGMGGSSLAPELFSLTFVSKMGFPDLLVLDSTDPAAVKKVLGSVNLPHTLFVVASKSGTTLEPLSFYKFFRDQFERTAKVGPRFVVITDPETPLEKLAKEQGFRQVFLNPPSIGGRYSALSYFGLVPAALIGVDVPTLLERAEAMAEQCGVGVPLRENPGVVLGAILGAWAKQGRDKVTLCLSSDLRGFGVWIEQLLAESTGKNGRGLIPVDGEPLESPDVYGDDRVFVAITVEGDFDFELRLRALEEKKHPVVRLTLVDRLDLGAEFFRWEVATATAGALLEVNPFDEPNVQEAKDNTAKLFQAYRTRKRIPEWPVDCEEEGIKLLSNQGTKPASVTEGIAAHLKQAKPDDYLALLAYLPPGPEVSTRLQALRTLLRDRLKIATTVGYGPRYLHSTGQLHKGGPASGLFIQITCDDNEDLPVPGEPYTFGVLKSAQAQGDLEALRSCGRRVIRLHLDKKPREALARVNKLVSKALQA
jgi:glucose-6-phosphate isomerase